MKTAMLIPRSIKRILAIVTHSRWMKSDQESLPTFGLKIYAELTRTKKGKKLEIKSFSDNKIDYENYIVPSFHGVITGLAT